MKSLKFLQIVLFFVGLFVVVNLFTDNKNNQSDTAPTADIDIKAVKNPFSLGDIVEVKITNNTKLDLNPWQDCPYEPLNVFEWQNGEWVQKNSQATAAVCPQTEIIASKANKVLSYSNWNYELFNQLGRYKIVYPDGKKEFSTEFEIVPRSFLGQIWDSFFYKPIYNTLIFFASILPGHNLGWAIVLLTLLIKIILIGPNHKALKAQKALQKVQPELDHIKTKYKGDQQKIAQETMAVWKKHKVNPMGSCLPMLIQFPVMIALFYVIKIGLSPSNLHLLYTPLKGFDLTLINPIFLGVLNLTQVNAFVLPLIVGGLQFFQMKLSFSMKNKKTDGETKAAASETQMMNQMMTYTLPVMIAFFTATMPAAVGIYWGVSTLFGILQQIYINRKHH